MVHWEASGLRAKVENSGHGDACGPIVLQDYKHLKDGTVLDDTTTNSIRQNLINLGLMSSSGGGMTMEDIRGACEHYGFGIIKFADYQANLNFEQLHSDMEIALEAHQFVIIETSNAQALPDNQSGVQYHFILLGGIDSGLGYLTCNGDTETGLNSGSETTEPVWYGIGAISASRPVGYIILESLENLNPVITIEKDDLGNVTGAVDDTNGKTLGAGFALATEQQNLTAETISLAESYVDVGTEHIAICVLGDRYLGTWLSGRPVELKDWFEAAQVVENLYARSIIHQPTVDNDSAVAAAIGLVSQDAANVAMHAGHVEEFVTELLKDISTLTIAQTSDK